MATTRAFEQRDWQRTADMEIADEGIDVAHGMADRLRRVGQRATPQRLVILGALTPGEHLTVDDVFARVEPMLPSVNRSTVYRTLELFSDLGLVSVTDLGCGARQFELIDEPHHHLICHRCGAILELDDDLVDPLRAAIRARYGFAPAIDHLALFGFCAECRRDVDAPEPDRGDRR
ncbi:MAG TPA: Fur family transcriptional regulator [Thermomicrobiaceae bacterium]|jgi:Fur family ferric uptake transcriptional regulator|nr:Fur family transcriptional regulator [Thermomicrobiaceae bacterium]